MTVKAMTGWDWRGFAAKVALTLLLASGILAGCETAGAAEDDKACCKLAAMDRCDCTLTSAQAAYALSSGDPAFCSAILAEDLYDYEYASAQEACERSQYAVPGCYERIMQSCE
jgi:hypothetical protein